MKLISTWGLLLIPNKRIRNAFISIISLFWISTLTLHHRVLQYVDSNASRKEIDLPILSPFEYTYYFQQRKDESDSFHNKKKLVEIQSQQSINVQRDEKNADESQSNSKMTDLEKMVWRDNTCREWPSSSAAFTEAIGNSNDSGNKTSAMVFRDRQWLFPALDLNLINRTFGNRRTVFVGDSTLGKYLTPVLRSYLDELQSKNTTMDFVGYRGGYHKYDCDFEHIWHRVEQLRPHIMVVNWGFHMFHTVGRNDDDELMLFNRTVNQNKLCNIDQWVNYETKILQRALQIAVECKYTKVLLFKTTNFVCEERAPVFLGRTSRYAKERNIDFMHSCNRYVQEKLKDQQKIDLYPDTLRRLYHNNYAQSKINLSSQNIEDYCWNGGYMEEASRHLNDRLRKYLQAQTTIKIPDNMTVAIYNDHDMETCSHAHSDGRHYQKLTIPSIRLMAHQIDCHFRNRSNRMCLVKQKQMTIRQADTPERNDHKQQQYPTPIFVMGLPKVGTSSITDFFNRSGYQTSHWKCRNREDEEVFCGKCIEQAVKDKQSILSSCGNDEVYAQMDYVGGETICGMKTNDTCIFPQIQFLDQIHKESPNATFILNTRNLTKWAKSTKRWNRMDRRMAACEVGPSSSSFEALIDWHKRHLQRIHSFVEKHPSHKLVVVDIEDPNTGEIMAAKFRSDDSFWGHSNPLDTNLKQRRRTTG